MKNYRLVERGKPLAQASKALILLHGRGGNARYMLPIASSFCDESFYIGALEAPENSWYPDRFLAEEALNEPKLSNSIAAIKNLRDTIAQHIDVSNIYLMGFSQGACLSLEVSARDAKSYGGIIAFTGALLGDMERPGKYQGDFKGTKVFIGTCEHDPFIPLEYSVRSKEIMNGLGAEVFLKVYEGQDHLVREDEIEVAKKLFRIP